MFIEKSSTEARALVERCSTEARALVERCSTEARALVERCSTESRALVEKSSTEARALVEKSSTEARVLVEKSSTEARALVEKSSTEARALVEKSSTEARALVEKSSTEARALVTETHIKPEKKINDDHEKLTLRSSSTFITRMVSTENSPQPMPKRDPIEELFSLIIGKINENNKDQKQYFRAMLLKVLLTKNIALFKELMIELDLYELSNFDHYTKLLDLHKRDPQAILNSPILNYIQAELAKEEIKPLISLLLNVFQSIPELSKDKFGICLSMRAKKELLPKLLMQAQPQVKMSVLSQLTDLSFDSLLPGFRPSIGDQSYIPATITHKQYLNIITKNVDQSIFIVITIGYLKSNKLASKEFLQKLTAAYLFIDYEGCLKSIEKHFQELNLPDGFPGDYEQYVRSICQSVKELDYRDNDTRRFFETRLAQYINGLTHSEETLTQVGKPLEGLFDDSKLRLQTLNAANKILHFFLGEEGIVSSPLEMERKICIFANGYKDKEKYNTEQLEHFMKSCPAYNTRDRIPKAKETHILERKFETSADKVGEDIWNSAGGVMRSVSAIFFDAQLAPMRNMLVDSSEVSPKNESSTTAQWFWSNKRFRSAYVGSISGHTCNIVFMLNCYMKENQKDPNLEQDISLFLVQLVAVYAKRGYHGMLEVMDILHDQKVQEVFKKNNVTLDLMKYFSFDPDVAAFLEYAMNDASIYALVFANKKHVKLELARFFGQMEPTREDCVDHQRQTTTLEASSSVSNIKVG
ncbi:Dot/Icm T4SS effector Ceg14/sidL [Legionella parisiensis]|nr:Dot/Icm T4SS effector Ceg14/sidL [Legionella parisiensis]